MANTEKLDDVFTLEPEMRAGPIIEPLPESFTERLNRVAKRLANNADDRPDLTDALPGILQGFTFHDEPMDRGMMMAVIAAPVAFVVFVISTLIFFGGNGVGVTTDFAAVDATNNVAVTVHPQPANLALAEPVLVAPPRRSAVSATKIGTQVSIGNEASAIRDWAIKIPKGAVIRNIDLDGSRIAIHLFTDDVEKIVIYDTVSGKLAANLTAE